MISSMISFGSLASRLAEFLPRQRWFGAKDRTIELVRVLSIDVLKEGWPALLRAEVEVSLEGLDGPADVYQLLVGLRPAGESIEFLSGHEAAVLGEFDTDQGQALAYDALLDSELALVQLTVVAQDCTAERVRPIGVEQSNTSLVYDEAMILKIFRRLLPGRNPEVEVTEALHKVGFAHVAEPIASWNDGVRDLGFLQRFLAGSIEGWAMALTSLRDLYGDPRDPAEAGGDFGAESYRLGSVTAELHLALGAAFGTTETDGAELAVGMEEQARRVLASTPDLLAGALRLFGRLRTLPESVPATRVHGDYHLGQVMRTDAGWYVLDFEGEPARPLEERIRPTSPVKDVAGMLRSFHYASVVAMATQVDDVTGVAKAWESRNRDCFLSGYWTTATDEAAAISILPEDPVARSTVLSAFELDKAIYEVAYERAHRPDWEPIPLEACRRLTNVREGART